MNSSAGRGPIKRRWRHYATPSGERPVDTYLDGLTDDEAARVLARMSKIRIEGTTAARHLVEDLWEARVDGLDVTHRTLFTEEANKARILLAISGFTKKSPENASQHHQGRAPETRRVAVARRLGTSGCLTISVITDRIQHGGRPWMTSTARSIAEP